jgi:hypothetical protein
MSDNRSRWCVLVSAVSLFGAGCSHPIGGRPTAASAERATIVHADGNEDQSGDQEVIKLGDSLFVIVEGTMGQFSVVVDDTGKIYMPYISKMPAAGLTASEFKVRTREKHVPNFSRDLSVDVVLPELIAWHEAEPSRPGRRKFNRDPLGPGDFWLPREIGPQHLATTKEDKIPQKHQSQQAAGGDFRSETTRSEAPQQ